MHAVLAPCLREHLELDIGCRSATGAEPSLYRPHLFEIERKPPFSGEAEELTIIHCGKVVMLDRKPLLPALREYWLNLPKLPTLDHRVCEEHSGEL